MASKQFITHNELVEIGYRWLLNTHKCSFAFKELKASGWEIPDVIGFKWNHSVLIECKSTRQDFLKDKTKPFRKNPELGMGEYRFFLCPEDLIKVSDLPEKWGLIYTTGKKCKTIHNPYAEHPKSNYWNNGFKERNHANERGLCHSALRRIHLHGLIDQIYSYDPLYEKKQ